MSGSSELLTDCRAHGVRLVLAGNDNLMIDAPRDVLTPDLLERLRAHKAELVALLRPMPDVAPDPRVAAQDAPTEPTTSVCRCGSTTWRDVPIHDRRSVRRDCVRCERFLDFPIWLGKGTLQNEK
jgi:hypothetical protein